MVAREKSRPPMTLANMRGNGVHAVIAACQSCGPRPILGRIARDNYEPSETDDSNAVTAEGSESIRDPRGIQCDQTTPCRPDNLSLESIGVLEK
jgi:hypothetical protein